MSPLAALRRRARVSRAACARACGLSEGGYGRLERGQFDPRGRDPIGLLTPVARLLSAKLGEPVSAQWDLCGAAPSQPRHDAGRAATPTGKRGSAGPCASAARPAASTGDRRR